MKARVKPTSRYGVCTAFSGREYVKFEWREVPAGLEAEAERNQYLETDAHIEAEPQEVFIPIAEDKPVVEPIAEPVFESPAEVAKTPGRKAGRPRHAGG